MKMNQHQTVLKSINNQSPVRVGVKGVFLALTIFLMLFPFINTLNEFLVRIVEPLIFFKPLQELIIPYEARLVRVFLDFLAVPVAAGEPASQIITLVGKTGGLDPVAIGWNCLGWQSLVLILASLVMGLQGKFTLTSKIEVLLIGLLVTFWLNIFRLTTIFYLYYHLDRSKALIFHNYGAVILTIVWLFVFWWFSFKFVLESR